MTHTLVDWACSDEVAAGTRSEALSAHPDVWTDGNLVRDEVSGICCGGEGRGRASWFHRTWGHLGLLPSDEETGVERCRLYLSVPEPCRRFNRLSSEESLLRFRPPSPYTSG